jgi:hypothetical protein
MAGQKDGLLRREAAGRICKKAATTPHTITAHTVSEQPLPALFVIPNWLFCQLFYDA